MFLVGNLPVVFPFVLHVGGFDLSFRFEFNLVIFYCFVLGAVQRMSHVEVDFLTLKNLAPTSS